MLSPRELHVLYGAVGLVWVLVFYAAWVDAGKADARQKALDAANQD